MSAAVSMQTQIAKSKAVSNSKHPGLLVQRQCACGSSTSKLTGACPECQKKRLQTKLRIGASNDPFEQEADRVADQVMSAGNNPTINNAPPRIQRLTSHSRGENTSAPASVDRVLASGGRPLEPALQQDMSQRFGHDFSRVRVHSDAEAEQSARDVNAHAYTVGHNVVFGAGQYVPQTHAGRRLLAHELTHVVQQSDSGNSDRVCTAPLNAENMTSPHSMSTERPLTVSQATAPSLVQREGALLGFQADMEQRRKRVESLDRAGDASIGLFDDGAGKISGYQLTQNFELKLKSDARADNYALVQWIKGEISQPTSKGKAYWPANTALHGRSANDPWLFNDWIIDTPDADPRFGSHTGLTVQVPTTQFEDSPGVIAKQALPVGLKFQVDARMGVYPWGTRIPTTISEWESMKPTPFKEVEWGWDITIKADQKALDINIK